jgi:SEC-C motif-containing protein
MRSRYSAFAFRDAPYLLRSWHPDTRPFLVELDDDTVWRRLQIVDTVAGGEADETGVVEFRAVFRDASGFTALHERSRFVRVHGAWVYLDGDLLD